MRSFKTFSLLSVCIILIPTASQAGWWRTYGTENYENGTCVQLTDDGNYIVAGSYLLKVDKEGKLLWKSDVGGYCLSLTSDGGYILTRRNGLIKTDDKGKVVWKKTYDYPLDCNLCGIIHVEQTYDGGFVSIGTISSHDYESGPIVIKTDTLGDEEWVWSYETVDLDFGECIQQTSDSGLIVLVNFAGGLIYLSKFPSDFRNSPYSWRKLYRIGPGYFIRETVDGGYVVTGQDYHGILIFKASPSGDSLWTKIYEGSDGECIQLTEDGGFIVVGYGYSDEKDDIYLLKTDSLGNQEWSRTFGGINDDFVNFVQPTEDGGYIVVGSTSSFGAGGTDIWVIKTDSLGNVGDIPLNISPVLVWAPERMQNTNIVTPSALFENISTEDFAGNFFCHCEITDLATEEVIYHDSVEVTDGLSILESKTIEFNKWSTYDTSEFQALFCTVGEFESDSMEVGFRWTGIAEEPDDPDLLFEWELVESFGPEIILRYPDLTETVSISLFDPSGRRVDETEVSGSSGTVTWGEGFAPGVYFIHFSSGKIEGTHKVVLIR